MQGKLKSIFIIVLLLCGGAFNQAFSQSFSSLMGLAPFERAVLIIKYYEGWHTRKDYPYIGYGHRIQPNDNLTYPISRQQGDSLLRSDLLKHCALFRQYGKDSLLLACVSYNCGPARITGNGKNIPKSRLLKKLEAGQRDILPEYLGFCRYKGRPHAGIRRRRWVEYQMLYMP